MVTNDTNVYTGVLEIDYDRIIITDYFEIQTPLLGDDNERPFRGFTKNVTLKGYSENGKLFIEDRGQLQQGVPYTCWDANSPPFYKFLSFTFGGKPETLRRQ